MRNPKIIKNRNSKNSIGIFLTVSLSHAHLLMTCHVLKISLLQNPGRLWRGHAPLPFDLWGGTGRTAGTRWDCGGASRQQWDPGITGQRDKRWPSTVAKSAACTASPRHIHTQARARERWGRSMLGGGASLVTMLMLTRSSGKQQRPRRLPVNLYNASAVSRATQRHSADGPQNTAAPPLRRC